jgi:DNA-binding NarL/FixJ family response regulator
MTRIAIVDDHKLFSAGLKLLVSSLGPSIVSEIFDQPRTFLSAIEVEKTSYDLVMLDFYIPGYWAVDIIAQLKCRHPQIRVMVISASISPADRQQALNAGADSYLRKHMDPKQFLEGITALLNGDGAADCGEMLDEVATNLNLTARQLDILILASKGFSNKEIARMLTLSPETVKSHLSDVYQRFSVSNRLEAIEYARSLGLC